MILAGERGMWLNRMKRVTPVIFRACPLSAMFSYWDFTRVALASVTLTEECNSNFESAACGAGSPTQEGKCGIAVHACSNGYILRALQLHPNTTLPAWTLSSACCYLCCFAFTRPLVHCGGGGLNTTRVPRMVVVFLWFCLYVPCTGYTVFICRERIYGVKSEINFIFTKARECSRACTWNMTTCPRIMSVLFHSSPAQPAGKELLLNHRLFWK